MQFTQNFTLVSDNIIDLLFKWMPYACFDTFFWILPHMGPATGTPRVKTQAILGNSKMSATATLVHQRKKLRKQNSLMSMSYTCIVPKCLTSVESLKH